MEKSRAASRKWPVLGVALSLSVGGTAIAATGAKPAKPLVPHFTEAVAFDVSLPLNTMAWQAPLRKIPYGKTQEEERAG